MNIQEPFRLVHTFGDAFDPGNEYGCVVLQLFGDGRVLVDNVFGGGFTKSWEGRTERRTIERVLAALDEAGFPGVEDHRIPPGATLRVIDVQSGGKGAHNRPIEWSAGRKMKGYGEAFRILDGMVAELTQGAVPMVELIEERLVRRTETPIRPAIGIDAAYELGSAAAEGARSEAGWGTGEIVGGRAAEAFALGRAVAEVRLALDKGTPDRMAMAVALLQLSHHAPAREIAALALRPPADFRPRLEALSAALRHELRPST